ncbi:MAG: hypothetical protein LBB65_06325, partial [Burkholderiales bacterium]|nr:hypothetical protein [Burkholderiales bacterium]
MDFIAQTKPLVIPNDSYIIPPVNFPSSVSSPGTVNSASTNQPREWQLASIAAVGTVLPLIYGADKVSAKYLDVFQQGNKVWLVVVWA